MPLLTRTITWLSDAVWGPWNTAIGPVPGPLVVLLLAVGMGICNAAVFKIVPQAVPKAVGGAAGWVGGLGAFGGFVIPPVMAMAVHNLGTPGYAIGFITFVFLSLFSLSMAWILKYSREEKPAAEVTARKTTGYWMDSWKYGVGTAPQIVATIGPSSDATRAAPSSAGAPRACQFSSRSPRSSRRQR